MAIGCWKRLQQKLANVYEDGKVEEKDEQTRNYYDQLHELNKQLRQTFGFLFRLLDEVHDYALQRGEQGTFGRLLQVIAEAIAELMQMAFLVTQQPNQVLKAERMFDVTVSLLGGWRSDSLSSNRIQVQCVPCSPIVNTASASAVASENDITLEPSYVTLLAPLDRERPTQFAPQNSAGRSRKRCVKNLELRSIVAGKLPQAFHAELNGGLIKMKSEQ